MQRKLLPLAISAALASYNGLVMSDITAYGKVNLSLQNNSFDYLGLAQQNNWTLNSNSSFVGAKGKSKITDDLNAIYKLEYEVFVDGGGNQGLGVNNSNTFNQRNTYVGLASTDWGQVIAGKNDTPLKMAASGTDMFDNLVLGDINTYMVGEDRENNTIIYSTPEMAGFTVTAATILGEETNKEGDKAQQQNTALGDSLSGVIKYTANDMFWVALSGNSNVENTNIVRLNANLAVSDWTFNAQAQTADVSNNDLYENGNSGSYQSGIGSSKGLYGKYALWAALNGGGSCSPGKLTTSACHDYSGGIDKQDAYMANAKYQMGDWAFKAQIGQSTSDTFRDFSATGNRSFVATQTAVGVDYALNKNVTVFSYVSHIGVDLDNVASLKGKANDDAEFTTGGVGLEAKF